MFPHLPKRIVYLRHPQCLHNVDYEGALALGITTQLSPLTTKGEQQAAITAAYLNKTFGSFDRVFSSQFLRTQSIPQAAGFDFVIDARIGERWHGALNERGNAFFRENPEEEQRYHEDYYSYCAPGGESCPDVEDRLRDFLSDRVLFEECNQILLSGHGISGLMFRKVLTNASKTDWDEWFLHGRLRNASVTVYERDEVGYEIKLYNYIPWEDQIVVEAGLEA